MDSWFNAKFDHLKYTGYPLSGAHATLPCVACHINNVFKGTPAQCYSCHAADFNNSNNPPHVKLGLPRDCAICHTTLDWSNAKFDHALYAHYPLTGKHATVTCAQCHTNNNYNNTPTACVRVPPGGLQWHHQSTSRFGRIPDRLLAVPHHGRVDDVDIQSQHHQVPAHRRARDGDLRAVPRQQQLLGHAPDRLLRLPPRRITRTPTRRRTCFCRHSRPTCATCHNTTSWTGAAFDHSKTAFPLTGAHVTVACASCHVNGNYTTLPTDCYGCHTKDYNGTTNPNHAQAKIPHDVRGLPQHHQLDERQLRPQQDNVPADRCARDRALRVVPREQQLHHAADRLLRLPPEGLHRHHQPESREGRLPDGLRRYATTRPHGLTSTFDHAVSVPVNRCACDHRVRRCATPTTTSPLCRRLAYGCHQTDYNNTNAPPHKTAGFPTDCEVCHTTTNWLGAVFDHNKTTFPLTGAHTTVACAPAT